MADKRDEELGVSAVALESLERNFVEVMKELSAEDNLERFKIEYEKLHRALRKSHENEKRLIKKCQEVTQEIMSNAVKLQSALQLSQDDETTIASLRKEIEKAWKMVDSAHEKESRAKETIQELKKAVGRLTSHVEQGAGMSLGHEDNLQDLLDEKREAARQRDASRITLSQRTNELKERQERLKKAQSELEVADIDLVTRRAQYENMLRAFELEQKQRDASERRVQEYHQAIEGRTKESELAKDTLRARTEEKEAIERRAKAEREAMVDLGKRVAELQAQLAAQTQELTQLDHQNMMLKGEVPRRQLEHDKKEQELVAVSSRVRVLERAIETQDAEHLQLCAERDAELAKLPIIQSRIAAKMADLEKKGREIEERERAIKEKVREKNLTITKSAKEETERVKLEGQRLIEEGKNRSLAQELEANLRSNQLSRNQVGILEVQQKKLFEEAQEALAKFSAVTEQVKMGEERVAQLQLDLEDVHKKLKNQQALYEQVRSDRALYKKNLNDAESEIKSMERKFKLMDHHIDHLKDELSGKERLLCQAHATHKKLGKDIATAEQTVAKFKEDFIHKKGRNDALGDEIKQLTQIVADCDTEKAKQQMKYNSVVNERNILATQLIRRNDELGVLYEKIRVHQSTLSKGESQYRERLVDVRMLRDKVFEMRSSLKTALSRIQNIEEMKRQVTALQRHVMVERAKAKALYEELQNPLNVHRWRELEGSDPKELDNILKVQTLQKRLVSKTDECVAKDKVIRQKEAQYAQLKNILSRQPGPEIAEQLKIYHENVLQRTEQLARMEDQLAATRAHVQEELDKSTGLGRELVEVKKKYFTVKAKNQTLKREHTLSQQQARGIGATNEHGQAYAVHFHPSQPRFAGGGFSLSQ